LPKAKSLLTGNPLRREILEHCGSRGEAGENYGKLNLLVFGGSAGAHSINMAMIETLPLLEDMKERVEITHQTGEKDLDEVSAGYRSFGFKAQVLPFIHDMAEAYGKADLIVCRAGATTVAEVTACGKPCIFIPFPYATDDHQRKNAEALVEKGAGFMLLNRDLSGANLAHMIRELSGDTDRLRYAGICARSLARPDAAKIIVDEMLRA
jgi:UDP-N-acetylglucosamine--N-acetylmuramyl-(pentapeptide) pyrophosphoryl-undecaprenol N-acetylglucosamine transferase